MCRPKEDGGLGIINLEIFDEALLIKWWWTIMSRPKGMLQCLLVTKYVPKKGIWRFRMRNKTQMSAFWKGMLPSRAMFWSSISFSLGNGESISFWEDRWATDIPLKDIVPKFL